MVVVMVMVVVEVVVLVVVAVILVVVVVSVIPIQHTRLVRRLPYCRNQSFRIFFLFNQGYGVPTGEGYSSILSLSRDQLTFNCRVRELLMRF